MNDFAEINEEIEWLRSKLVALTKEFGDFLHPKVLHVSCVLDERIVAHSKLMAMNQAIGVRIR